MQEEHIQINAITNLSENKERELLHLTYMLNNEQQSDVNKNRVVLRISEMKLIVFIRIP